jgi:hypothetical protein
VVVVVVRRRSVAGTGYCTQHDTTHNTCCLPLSMILGNSGASGRDGARTDGWCLLPCPLDDRGQQLDPVSVDSVGARDVMP